MDMLDGVRRKKTERRVGSTSTLYEYCSILLLLDDHGACRQTERWPKSLDVWRFYDVGIEFVLCCFCFCCCFYCFVVLLFSFLRLLFLFIFLPLLSYILCTPARILFSSTTFSILFSHLSTRMGVVKKDHLVRSREKGELQ